MSFSWPSMQDITYRLWRLRRLIAVCTVLPLVFFSVMNLIGFGVIGSGTVGFIALTLVLFAMMAGHAVLFPNSNQETTAISLTMVVLALLAPIIGGSLFGWFLFLIFAFWMIWSGQQRILAWQSSRKPHSPVFKAAVRTTAPLEAARQWFPLRPGLKRGAFTCGEIGADGRFPVWYDTGQADWLDALGISPFTDAGPADFEDAEDATDTLGEPGFYALIEVDEPEFQRTQIIEAGESNEILSVVENRFTAKKSGVRVSEVDGAASFPWGQTMFMWLADFHADGLMHTRDLLEKRDLRAIRASHHLSLLALFSGWVMRRFMMRGVDDTDSEMPVGDGPSAPQTEISDKLGALLQRLGPDYQKNGYTSGPMPLVTIEDFFDGNDDDGSFQGASVDVAHRGLAALRDRDDVADIRLGITQWEGPTTWPLAEYLYFVTSASLADVKSWLKDSNIWVDEMNTDEEHRAREELNVPAGHRVVWAWID